ncbi:MAG: polysulfide reductase NrfD [Chloroflexi bacterium]|nr:polysulfide reductase NrfD [Chloroflexota bacterium]
MNGEGAVITYNVGHEIPLTILIAVYFYMTGLSAGSFILSTMAYGFGIEKFKPIGKVGVVMAIVLLGLAPLNLIADLGQPQRFWYLFPYLNFTSPVTWGSFLLTLYPINCIIYAYFMFKGDKKLTRTFGLIGIPLAVSVHGYTGFILALGKARALWNTALMPTYFLVSAMVSGIALMILVVMVRDKFFMPERKINRDIVSTLTSMLLVTIVLDLFLALSDVLVLLTADAEGKEGADLLLRGSFRPYFLGVELALGALVPLLMLLYPATRRRPQFVATACVFVMVGIFAMRYVMVIGGLAIPLS